MAVAGHRTLGRIRGNRRARFPLARNEDNDVDGLVALLAGHARHTVPPHPGGSEGRAAIRAAWTPRLVGPEARGGWRCLPVEVNRQVAPCTLDVLRIDDGLITEVPTFGREVFGPLGLPERR